MFYAEHSTGEDDDEDEDSDDNTSNGTAATLLSTVIPSSRDGATLSPLSSTGAGNNVISGTGVCASDELHFGEKWFHGKLGGKSSDKESGRVIAQQLLNRYSHLGDGVFLVRESETFVGDYTLSFWRQGKVNHCRIRTKQDRGATKYYLTDTLLFDSLYSLITHYQSHPLRSQEFFVYLKEPVPQPNSHENKEWYHAKLSKTQAEDMLKRMRYDGSFLVRQSEQEENCFAITFRADGMIKHCRIKQEGRLYSVGASQFESLVDLINHYEQHPLYRKVKLTYPISETTVRRLGSEPEDLVAANYIDSSAFPSNGSLMGTRNPTSSLSVKALYDYKAQRDDELSFPKHAIITNVVKQDRDWWTGNYGGKIRYWFPANFVQEIKVASTSDSFDADSISSNTSFCSRTGDSSLLPLGTLQKGFIDIVNCSVMTIPSTRGRESIFRIISPSSPAPIDIAAPNEEELTEWIQKIRDTSQSANEALKKGKKIERDLKIAKEFSSLIIYCRAVPFTPEATGNFTEMSSFPETKVEKWMTSSQVKFFMQYNRKQFTRVYPKGSRLDSSNYDPIRHWNVGIQMAALNYQTPDRAMQLNQAKFRANGGCGYIVRPDFMFNDSYDPYSRTPIDGVEPITLEVRIISGRHLRKQDDITRKSKSGTWSGRIIVSPYVEVEIAGCDFDCIKGATKTSVIRKY